MSLTYEVPFDSYWAFLWWCYGNFKILQIISTPPSSSQRIIHQFYRDNLLDKRNPSKDGGVQCCVMEEEVCFTCHFDFKLNNFLIGLGHLRQYFCPNAF